MYSRPNRSCWPGASAGWRSKRFIGAISMAALSMAALYSGPKSIMLAERQRRRNKYLLGALTMGAFAMGGLLWAAHSFSYFGG